MFSKKLIVRAKSILKHFVKQKNFLFQTFFTQKTRKLKINLKRKKKNIKIIIIIIFN